MATAILIGLGLVLLGAVQGAIFGLWLAPRLMLRATRRHGVCMICGPLERIEEVLEKIRVELEGAAEKLRVELARKRRGG